MDAVSRAPKLSVPVIASAPCLWFEPEGRGLCCEARWVWLRRMLPALCRDLCRNASAYERDGGACFCTAASRITSLSSLSGSPVLPSRSTWSKASLGWAINSAIRSSAMLNIIYLNKIITESRCLFHRRYRPLVKFTFSYRKFLQPACSHEKNNPKNIS